jgi:hypothetical protein
MTETLQPPAVSPADRAVRVTLGIVFIAVWLGAHLAWAAMALFANLMANDSGAASESAHTSLIVGVLAGQVLAAGAGIPAGLAFFWRARRKPLLWCFAALFGVGALCQAWSFYAFFSSTPGR